MYGQFFPPMTGEATVNENVYEILTGLSGFKVFRVNSSLIRDVNDVGKFRIVKLFRFLNLFLRYLSVIYKVETLYVTPGQTLLGLLRVLPVMAVAKLLQVRVIAHWHGYGLLFCFLKRPTLVSFILRFIDDNIVLTKDLKTQLEQAGAKLTKVHIVNNYVDKPAGSKFDKDEFSVLYLGSLMPEKGIDSFLAAAEKVHYCSFVICGTGSYIEVEKVRNYASRCSNIAYKGLVTGDEKLGILRKSSVFVLQSHYPTEGVPLSMLEAMSHGCAIITTKHNGIPEVLDDSGIYVKKNSSIDLINSIEELYQTPELLQRYSSAALSRSNNYRFDTFKKDLVKIFVEEG